MSGLQTVSQTNNWTPSSRDFASALTLLEAERARRKATNRLKDYRPYSKQRDFHALGATKRERLFLAGNQLGKTVAGGFELAMHLTGRYPDWWEGRRWDRPIAAWASGITGESTRDNPQRILMGRAGDWGTGAIPAECIVSTSRAIGVPDLIDTAKIRHISGGVSTLAFKFYEKGRTKWQGETLDFIWFDEEPPEDIYAEGLTRTNATGGLVDITATPLLGMTQVIGLFYPEPNTPDRGLVQMTIDDAEHYSDADRQKIIAGYLPHEREARAKGIPMLGSGRVFPVAEESLLIEPIALAPHWPRICGLDIGWEHPTAAAWLAWDRDADVLYLTDCYRVKEQSVPVHASAIKARGNWIPVAWPHDAYQHDKGSGQIIAKQYEREGVAMLPEHAHFPDQERGNSVEAGVSEMLIRMQTGRFRVFKHCVDWVSEFRQYHRKDGLIVKEYDDLMSASRYALMMLRHAKLAPKARVAKDRAPHQGAWLG